MMDRPVKTKEMCYITVGCCTFSDGTASEINHWNCVSVHADDGTADLVPSFSASD